MLRVGLARKLIKRRWAVGLSQAELARRAGIRPETLNRIERAKVTADTATVSKIVRVLEKAEREQRPEG
ncbi:MAG TPA: helix-turn-helix domain-containing protein [Tepidisphaeraceae bacterium]|nr:helix-turn-helix domain-containing protein [Tepidisphaeraceae bacterium]